MSNHALELSVEPALNRETDELTSSDHATEQTSVNSSSPSLNDPSQLAGELENTASDFPGLAPQLAAMHLESSSPPSLIIADGKTYNPPVIAIC